MPPRRRGRLRIQAGHTARAGAGPDRPLTFDLDLSAGTDTVELNLRTNEGAGV